MTPPTTRMMMRPPISDTQRSLVAFSFCSATPVVSRSSVVRMTLDRKTLASSINALPRLVRNSASASASCCPFFSTMVRSISSIFSAMTADSRASMAADSL